MWARFNQAICERSRLGFCSGAIALKLKLPSLRLSPAIPSPCDIICDLANLYQIYGSGFEIFYTGFAKAL
ncbi:MAG: hypothetical protein Kow00121_08120 [Elainellaceae cyanobacterium]